MNLLQIALVTFLAILPISNPFSTIPLFLSLTKGQSKEWSTQQALKAALYAAGILLVFLWSGAIIIEFFGISIPAIRIAGGMIIMRIGFGMMNPKEDDIISDEAKKESKKKKDISFTPLAMPSISGPGSISVVISMAAAAENLPGYLGVSIGIIGLVVVAYLAMRGAPMISKLLGVAGMDALTRIMGFILICVSFQFIFDGIGGYLGSGRFLEPLIEKVLMILSN